MSTKPMKPIKPPKKEIHLEDTESIKCDDCGNYSFIKSYFIRKVMSKNTGAGKGDKLRRGITQDEWEKKWEKIFGKKEKSIRPHKSDNKGSKS